MPLIPIIKGANPLPNLPGPVLNREKGPTVDSSGVSKGVQLLANSTKMPAVPDSIAAPFGALGAVGKAISQTGNLVSALAIKQREAETDIQVAGFDNGAQKLSADFEVYKVENRDPSTWVPEWNKRWNEFTTQFMENDKLHPGAREQIAMRASRYGGQSSASVTTSAAKETFAQAKSSFLSVMDSATETQDEARFNDALTTAQEKGYLYPHEVEAASQRFTERGKQLTREAEAEAERNAYNAEKLEATANPKEWLEAHKEPKGNLEAWKRLTSDATQSLRLNTASVVNDVTNAIADGTFTVPAEIDAVESKFLTPELREQAKRYMGSRNNFDEAQAQEGEQGIRNAVDLRQKALDYKAEGDDGTQYFTLKEKLNSTVPPGSREIIASILDSKFTGKRPPVKDVQKKYLSDTIDNAFDPSRGPIPWRKVINSRDAKGNPIPDKNEPGGYKLEWSDDLTAKQRWLDTKAKVEMKVGQWMEANPNATQDQIKAQVLEVLPEGTRKGALDAMKKAAKVPTANVGTVTSYGYANDSTPDSNSKAGIGAFVPDAEADKIKAGKPSDYKLRADDLAVSPDIEAQFREAGVQPGQTVMVQLANGETRSVRWMDRTAQDSDITAGRVKGVTKFLRGRFDFYSPNGKSNLDGVKVVRWFKPESLLVRN